MEYCRGLTIKLGYRDNNVHNYILYSATILLLLESAPDRGHAVTRQRDSHELSQVGSACLIDIFTITTCDVTVLPLVSFNVKITSQLGTERLSYVETDGANRTK